MNNNNLLTVFHTTEINCKCSINTALQKEQSGFFRYLKKATASESKSRHEIHHMNVLQSTTIIDQDIKTPISITQYKHTYNAL